MHFLQLLKIVQHKELSRFSYGLVYPCLLSVQCFSTSRHYRTRRKSSPYSNVDTERYSSLRNSVLSSKTSSQTPESLEEENGQIYGPVVKSKLHTQQPVAKAPKNFYPLLDHEWTGQLEKLETPARIILGRGSDRSTVPSVTRILKQTMSPQQKFYLERWKRRMVLELGEEGFNQYSLNLFRNGRLFHKALEDIFELSGEAKSDDVQSDAEVAGYMESIRHLLEDVDGVMAIESTVQHQSLRYLGIVDCVAYYRGVLCVIDWKTSEKPKPFLNNTYDNPVQVAAYIGALNSDDNYSYQVENGLIVVAYKDGSPAHPHFLSSEQVLHYWEKWLLRLEDYVHTCRTTDSSEA